MQHPGLTDSIVREFDHEVAGFPVHGGLHDLSQAASLVAQGTDTTLAANFVQSLIPWHGKPLFLHRDSLPTEGTGDQVPYSLIYPDFIDKATGKTLIVMPGSAYTIAVASGRNAAMPSTPNDGRWSGGAFQSLETFEVPVPGKPGEDVKITFDSGTGQFTAQPEPNPDPDPDTETDEEGGA